MTALRTTGGAWLAAVRWAARISALLLFGFVCAFLVGEGPPNPLALTAVENLLLVAFGIMWMGLLVGWRREGLGGATVLGGLLVFSTVNFIASGRLPGGAFALFAVPGVLFVTRFALGRRVAGAGVPDSGREQPHCGDDCGGGPAR